MGHKKPGSQPGFLFDQSQLYQATRSTTNGGGVGRFGAKR